MGKMHVLNGLTLSCSAGIFRSNSNNPTIDSVGNRLRSKLLTLMPGEGLDIPWTLNDHCAMRRVGDILARNNDLIGQIMKIRNKWKEIAGEVLSSHSEPVMIKKRVLQVMCDSPAWAQQIGMMTTVIEKQIRDITGVRILKVEGRFGIAGQNPEKGRTVRVLARPEIDIEDVNRLKDPELARAVREWMGIGDLDVV